jgi:hypothetical protein
MAKRMQVLADDLAAAKKSQEARNLRREMMRLSKEIEHATRTDSKRQD